mgnify:CR=1 FL=1
MASNPITSLLTEAMDCADRLPEDPITAMHEAVEFVAEVVELPDWLPAFERLIHTMIKYRSIP